MVWPARRFTELNTCKGPMRSSSSTGGTTTTMTRLRLYVALCCEEVSPMDFVMLVYQYATRFVESAIQNGVLAKIVRYLSQSGGRRERTIGVTERPHPPSRD